jgi:hypothetical protein
MGLVGNVGLVQIVTQIHVSCEMEGCEWKQRQALLQRLIPSNAQLEEVNCSKGSIRNNARLAKANGPKRGADAAPPGAHPTRVEQRYLS